MSFAVFKQPVIEKLAWNQIEAFPFFISVFKASHPSAKVESTLKIPQNIMFGAILKKHTISILFYPNLFDAADGNLEGHESQFGHLF